MNHRPGIPAFAFPAEAGTHLPTPERWKAELACGNFTKFTLMVQLGTKIN